MTYVQMILFGNEELIILRGVKFYHRICTTLGFYFHLTFFFFFVCVFAPVHIHDIGFWIINGLWKRKTMYSIFNKSKKNSIKLTTKANCKVFIPLHICSYSELQFILVIYGPFFFLNYTVYTHCVLNNNIEHYIFWSKKMKNPQFIKID